MSNQETPFLRAPREAQFIVHFSQPIRQVLLMLAGVGGSLSGAG